MVALCTLLALAPPIACPFSVTAARRARTSSLKPTGRRSTVTDACNPPRKVTASLLARPAIVPLAALYSLSAFAPPISHAFNATTPRRAHASLPGPWICPAITQLGSMDTSGLELSQLGPDASPPAPPPLNFHSSGINPKRLWKVITPVGMISVLGRRNELKSKGKLHSLDMAAPAPSSEAHFTVPPDFSFQFSEKNGCCLEGNNKSMSILKIGSRIQISEDHAVVNENSAPVLLKMMPATVLRPTTPATPSTPNLRGHRPEITDNECCFSGKERQRILQFPKQLLFPTRSGHFPTPGGHFPTCPCHELRRPPPRIA